jgi:hypothetical protein
VKIMRSELAEREGRFECTVRLPLDALAAFMQLLPAADTVYDIPIEFVGAPPEERSAPPDPERVAGSPPAVASPAPAQVVAPGGIDISRIGGGRSLQKDVMVALAMIRDPVFQEWVIRESGEPHTAIADAVDFAGRYIARQVGAPNLFELEPAQIPRLADVRSRFEDHLRTRGLAASAVPA